MDLGNSSSMKHLATALFLILIISLPAGAADVQATVDRTQTTVNEPVILSVTVKGGAGDVDISPIKDFRVMSRGTSTSLRVVNGTMSRQAVYTYALFPFRSGRLNIPALDVTNGDGNAFRTRQISIQVTDQPAHAEASRDVFVKAFVSEAEPYQGQQLTYTFRVYAAVSFQSARFQQPDFKGFSSKEVEERKKFTTVISGREYNVVELVFVLVPLKTGELTIGPATLELDLVRRTNRRRSSTFDSIFDDPFFSRGRLEQRSFQTRALPVRVKPLPDYDLGNVAFSGLVGAFSLTAELEAASVRVGDSTTLTVTVEGSGNIMDASYPDVTIPSAFKVYQDTPEEAVTVGPEGFSGKKIFRSALVAVKGGRFTLGPVEMSYFDTSTGGYRIMSADSLPLVAEAVGGDGASEDIQVFSAPADQPGLPQFKKNKVEFTGRDILPVKEELDALETRGSLSPLTFIIILMAAPVCFFAIRVVGYLTRKSTDPGHLMAERSAQSLKLANHAGVADSDFLGHIYLALISAILSLNGTHGESLTCVEARQILSERGVPESIIESASVLLAKIESSKYGGGRLNADDRSALFEETRQLIGELGR